MRTVFYTHCSDDWYEPSGCYKLEQSLRRIHPEIPFIRFGSAEIEEQKRLEPRLHWDVMIPIWGKLLAREYDLVVHFDADSIVTAPLDAVLAGDYEVAGVRNNDDFGDLHLSCPNVSPRDYLNCGLVAATRPDFWDDWHAANLATAHQFPIAENDVFNQVYYSGRYRTKLLDPPEAPYYYGVAAHAPRWREITLDHGRLMLRGKQVKVLHRAGGHHLPKLPLVGQFTTDVVKWLFRLTNSPYVKDAAGKLRGLGYPGFIEAYFEPSGWLPQVLQAMNQQDILRSRLGPCDVVLDLGGHRGLFSTFISPMAGRVIACEPCPEFQSAFEETMAHTGVTNVELCRKAVWTSSGEGQLHLCPANTTMHSLVATGVHGSGALTVATTTLADMLAEYGIGHVDLLKIDIEGAELPLLLDPSFEAVASRIRTLWVECHPVPPRGLSRDAVKGKITSRLALLGYGVELGETELFAHRPG